VLVSSRGCPLNPIQKFLGCADNEIIIFSPYIRLDALKELLGDTNKQVTLITTYKLKDLWSGASDINLYPYASENSYKIFINNNLHLKTYIIDWSKFIFGSSNLSGHGLGMHASYNLELNSDVRFLDIEVELYLHQILTESILLDDMLYKQIYMAYQSLPEPVQIDDIKLEKYSHEKDFLISSLPMTKSITRLYELITGGFITDDKEELDCAIHDCALYQIPTVISFEVYLDILKERFFNSAFIQGLIEYIESKERYFGEVKEWIQLNCADVPVPSRRTLTANIQVLFKWIVELSDGKYIVDRPHYSERIYRIKNDDE